MPKTQTIAIVIALVVLATFGRICRHDFAGFDDESTLYGNPRLNPPTLQGTLYYWTSPELKLYIPVTYTVWAALAHVAYLETPDDHGIHLNPWVFHTASVLLHVAATLAVFAILLQIIPRPFPAAAGALLFGLHPVQVETVAWASGMKDLLFAFFSLLAIWQYLLFLNAPAKPTRHLHYPLATLWFILALLSKPTAMVVPLIVAVLARWVIRLPWRRILATLWPWLLLSLLCAILTKLVQPAIGVPVTPWWTRPLIAADALTFYLYKLLAPAGLAVDYGRRPQVILEVWWVGLTSLVPATLACLIWMFRRRFPLLLVAALTFVIALSPVLGLVPFDFQGYSTVSDHYLYLPLLGLALAAAWLLHQSRARIGLAITCAILLALATRSFLQARHWQTDSEIWRHTLTVNPDSWVANVDVGIRLAQAGHPHQGAEHFRQALRAYPDYGSAHENLAVYLISQGQHQEALTHIHAIIRTAETVPANRPHLANAHNLWGVVLLEQQLYPQAAQQFSRALQINPRHVEAAQNLPIALERARACAPAPTTRSAPSTSASE